MNQLTTNLELEIQNAKLSHENYQNDFHKLKRKTYYRRKLLTKSRMFNNAIVKFCERMITIVTYVKINPKRSKQYKLFMKKEHFRLTELSRSCQCKFPKTLLKNNNLISLLTSL